MASNLLVGAINFIDSWSCSNLQQYTAAHHAIILYISIQIIFHVSAMQTFQISPTLTLQISTKLKIIRSILTALVYWVAYSMDFLGGMDLEFSNIYVSNHIVLVELEL